MSSSPRVLVVGGGLAGLTAAWRLQGAGAHVTVLEQSAQVGGRSAATDPPGPASVVPARAPVLSGLVEDLGMAERVHRVRLGSGPARRGGGPRARLALRRLRGLLDWFGDSLDGRVPERGLRLDDRSTADFTRLYLGAGALRGALGAPFAELGLDPHETSRLLLLLLMDPWGDVALSRMHGLDELSEELGKRLADVRRGARVTEVQQDGRAVHLAGGDRVQGDAVLLATRAPDALTLAPGLAPAEERFLRGVHYADRPGAVPAFTVGHYRGAARLRQEQTQRFAGRHTLLCGDYLVAPHAEGAAVAGVRAADELLAAL